MTLSLEDQIGEALLALPETTEEIATHLASLGVRAECGSPSRCALAEYFIRRVAVPEEHFLLVGTNNVAVWPHFEDECLADVRFSHVLPAPRVGAVQDFISRFDAFEFPNLVAGSEVLA
jgi:hypothetical protein